jgi:hypothetical protein
MKSQKVIQATTTVWIDDFVKRFKKGGADFEKWLYEMGKEFVLELEKDPTMAEQMLKRYPEISKTTLVKLENIGKKALHPSLAILEGPGYEMLKKLPYSDQERYLKEPIVMYTFKNGTSSKLKVWAKNMARKVALQVFAHNHIRDEAEQRAYLEEQANQETIRKNKFPGGFKTTSKEFIFNGAGRLTWDEILELYRDSSKL